MDTNEIGIEEVSKRLKEACQKVDDLQNEMLAIQTELFVVKEQTKVKANSGSSAWDSRLLGATKKARRYMNGRMRDLLVEFNEAQDGKSELSSEIRGLHTSSFMVDYSYLAGALRVIDLWFEIYDKADQIWKTEAGLGRVRE